LLVQNNFINDLFTQKSRDVYIVHFLVQINDDDDDDSDNVVNDNDVEAE